jgi:hypothetical protein
MPDLASISTATRVIFVAAVLLLIDTFLSWQSVDLEVGGVNIASASQNAWHGFWGVVLGLLTIVLLVWVGIKVFKVDLNINVPEATTIAVLAGLIFLFALIKNLADDYSTIWSYIGVILAAIIGVGAYLRLQETEEIANLPGFGGGGGGGGATAAAPAAEAAATAETAAPAAEEAAADAEATASEAEGDMSDAAESAADAATEENK